MEKISQIKLMMFGSLLAVFLTFPAVAQAATLSFSPSSGSYAVGSVFTISVHVSSADQAINAASGVISFPQDKLEVTSLSKSDSIFTLWVQEPLFLNSVGTVNFEGIVLNPGFTGTNGKVITINFRTKVAGAAPVSFSSGSALANDGKGTNILTSLGNAQFSLGGAVPTIPESITPPTVSGAPLAPAISSPTHPDPNKWYNNSISRFVWGVSKNITASRILYDENSDSRPTVVYDPPISEKEISNVKDGVYYFHVQLRNKNGWGKISHFRFQIDTEPPEPFTIKFIDGKETENPQPTVVFDTTDSLSDIDYYKIKIGEGDFFSVSPEIVIKSNPYTLPIQLPGTHNILVQAFDKANNYTVATEEFVIKSIEMPATFRVGSWTVSFLSVVASLAALIAILFFILWYGWYKFLRLRRAVKKEVREAESVVHKVTDLLKEDIREQIKLLEKTRTKRQLTEKEERTVKKLERDLDDAEKFIKKEIEDIEREVK